LKFWREFAEPDHGSYFTGRRLIGCDMQPDYLSQDVFDREIERISYGVWHAVAFLSDLRNPNDFVLEQIGRKEVIIQNVGGRVCAFTNVCPHRFSAIHNVPKGNRALVCPYHQWRFDQNGCASFPAIADASQITHKPHLERWRVEAVGNVVYVCLNTSAPPLREYLGPSWAWIEAVSLSSGHEYETFETEIRANWKVIINNTIEFYHAYSVHPQTFRPMIDAPLRALEVLPTSQPHIHYAMRLKSDKQIRLDNLIGKTLKRPSIIGRNSYEHLYSFPNMTIGHVNGRSFSYFRYVPISPTATKLIARTWMPKPEKPSETIAQFCRDYAAENGPFIRKVSDEDKAICETVQRGLASRPPDWPQHFLGDENLIAQFHRDYFAIMG